MQEIKKTRGPAKGSGGRPPGSGTPAELLAKAQALREHLARPADPTRPHLGTTYELVRLPLSKLLASPDRLSRWWRGERVQLMEVEIAACWRWLLPH